MQNNSKDKQYKRTGRDQRGCRQEKNVRKESMFFYKAV